MKKQPLVIIATREPKKFAEQALALFATSNPKVKYVTNADFDHHCSPLDGSQVAASVGSKVEVEAKMDELAALECGECRLYNVGSKVQLAERDHIHCVACSTMIEYDKKRFAAYANAVASMEEDYEDEDEDEDKDESLAMKKKKSKKNKEKAMDDSMDSEDSFDMTESMEDDDEVMATKIGENIALLALPKGNKPLRVIATMANSHPKAQMATSEVFASSLNQAIGETTARSAIEEAGFTIVRLRTNSLIDNLEATVASRACIEAASVVEDERQKFERCLDIASSGALRGMFSASGLPQMYLEMAKALKQLNVTNPKETTSAILAKSLPIFVKGLLETASSLTLKEDNVLDEIAKQIGDVDTRAIDLTKVIAKNADDDDDDDDEGDDGTDEETVNAKKLEERLMTPARSAVTASDKSNKPKTRKSIFANL